MEIFIGQISCDVLFDSRHSIDDLSILHSRYIACIVINLYILFSFGYSALYYCWNIFAEYRVFSLWICIKNFSNADTIVYGYSVNQLICICHFFFFHISYYFRVGSNSSLTEATTSLVIYNEQINACDIFPMTSDRSNYIFKFHKKNLPIKNTN